MLLRKNFEGLRFSKNDKTFWTSESFWRLLIDNWHRPVLFCQGMIWVFFTEIIFTDDGFGKTLAWCHGYIRKYAGSRDFWFKDFGQSNKELSVSKRHLTFTQLREILLPAKRCSSTFVFGQWLKVFNTAVSRVSTDQLNKLKLISD